MAAPNFPQDVTEHLQAAIQLANRRVYLRFLEEAELLALDLPGAAVLVACVVLEQVQQHTERWSELRNQAVHGNVANVTFNQAKELVEDVRGLLQRQTMFGQDPYPLRAAVSPSQIQGKYRFVPTSADEFSRSKADEVSLEHDEHSL